MMTAVLVIGAVAIALLAVLVVGLLRSHAEIIRTLHELGVSEQGAPRANGGMRPRPRHDAGAPADIAGQSLSGSAVHVGVTGGDGLTLLAFLSSGCSSCMGLWSGLRDGDPAARMAGTRVVVVTKSPEAESLSRLRDLAPPDVTLVQSTEAWEAYGVPVSPYFVMIDGATGGVVGEGSATSWSQVGSLLGQALADAGPGNAPDEADGELRADAELRRAGIEPGDPSLYPNTPPARE